MGVKFLEDQGNIEEYVVRGGTIECDKGSHYDRLNMPHSHGVFLRGQAQMNVADSKARENIISFGACSGACPMPKCTPAIATKWINMTEPKLHIDGEMALLKNAYLFCVFGGRISIVDSGQ
jgi:hypothetical protein